jgi:fatty-acyl-CoA synthase
LFKIALSESYFPAQGGLEPPPLTFGDILRASAATAPNRAAIKELD